MSLPFCRDVVGVFESQPTGQRKRGDKACGKRRKKKEGKDEDVVGWGAEKELVKKKRKS